MSHPSASHAADILIVDDTPANLQLLAGMLRERGYKVRPVPDGETALRVVRTVIPDLVLLDITMPGMDGYEVCRRLKSDARLRDIPVLFISALHETEDKIRAFQAGGVDYVSKPFQLEEVEARVGTHLQLRRQQLELKRNYEELREFERLRDSLTHMIAHDMKSPLLVVQLALDMVGRSAPGGDADVDEMITMARTSISTLLEMIAQMLDVSRMESGAMKLEVAQADLVACARRAVEGQRMTVGARAVAIESAGPVHLPCDEALVRRVIANLVGNALKFTPEQGRIEIRVARSGDVARVEVCDNGPGIAPEHHALIFEKFGQVENKGSRRGTGLGLTFARMAVEAHGGRIGVSSAPGQGSTFWFTLPATA